MKKARGRSHSARVRCETADERNKRAVEAFLSVIFGSPRRLKETPSVILERPAVERFSTTMQDWRSWWGGADLHIDIVCKGFFTGGANECLCCGNFDSRSG